MIEELFRQGLLKKGKPSKQMALRSIERAFEELENAKKNIEIGLFKTAIVLAYGSMFHAARAIAFNDGINERSHFALIQYLIEKHPTQLNAGMLNKLDSYRRIRHSLNYGLDSKANEEEAENAIGFAETFLQETREFLGM